MKRMLAIFFIVHVFTGSTMASELMKLPMLLRHYNEHEKAHASGLSFSDFLWEHYVDDANADERDGHSHESIPFKHCHDCCSHVSAIVFCVLPETSSVIVLQPVEREIVFLHNAQFRSFYQSCIWQPPQLG